MSGRKEEKAEESLDEVNEKISEIKKKIQLSEGQRKAHFEECDAEKKRNVERIACLKREVREIYGKLAEPSHCKDSILRTSESYPKDVGALRNKELEDAIVFMDLKCIDLNKRLDVLRYRNKTKKMKLKNLAEEFRDLKAKGFGKKARKVETLSKKPVCMLENQIHRVEMNMMEAEHVNKKYRSIRVQLMSESVDFESSLGKLEEEIAKQEAEIKALEAINKAALDLRDATKGTLLRHELQALNAGKTRENQLLDFRRRVEERKLELEKLERKIFPGGRSAFEEVAEGVQAAQGSEGAGRSLALLESQLAKLKAATGETETEEVLPRFLSQKETKQRLDFLKRITEEEKKELEMRKELGLAELEAFKFAEVKEKEESQEEIEKVNLAIQSERDLRVKHLEEAKRISEQLASVTEFLCSLIDLLQGMNEESAPHPSGDATDCCAVVDILLRKIKSGLAELESGESLREALKNLEGKQWYVAASEVPIRITREEAPLFPGLLQQEEGKQTKGQQQPSLLVAEEDEEEDVLNRAFVKRQAQLIVDAKSRKKFGRVLNYPKGKK